AAPHPPCRVAERRSTMARCPDQRPALFPGLLQTEPYMRAVPAMTRSAARADRAVALRPTSTMLKQPAEVAHHRALFDEVAAESLDPGATRKTIEAELSP
ncbi:MAG: hypothetical protein SYR96_10735, partial [Actinomycetota bacterium]|nr:hypothetical protein [Actinomycetota bacterium]